MLYLLLLSLVVVQVQPFFRPPQPKSTVIKTSSSLSNDLLSLLDLNNDNTVSVDEFERLIEHYNIQSIDDFDINSEETQELFAQLDDNNNLKINEQEITTALRKKSSFMAMTSEDVQVWLEKCTDLQKYRAHFLEHNAKGTDLMNPAASEVANIRSIIHDQDHRLLRAAVMGALLRSYYLSDRIAYVPAPKLVEVRATLITMKILKSAKSSNSGKNKSRFRVVKYKVQICRTSAKATWRSGPAVPECGFGWKSVWPTDGISEVRFVGLSPVTSYKLRVRAYHCDGKSFSGDTLDVQTLTRPSMKTILLSPSKWLKMCYLPPLTPVAPLLVSRTATSVLLEWGKSCRVDSSHLRLSQECGEQLDAGWDIPIVKSISKFLHEQMYCKRQKFVVQYVELSKDRGSSSKKMSINNDGGTGGSNGINGDSGNSGNGVNDEENKKMEELLSSSVATTTRVVDAHCAKKDEQENTLNDNPLDCLVRDLKPGTMYSFRLAVEADGMISYFSEPQHIVRFKNLKKMKN